jgi:hypothetical protein
LSNRLSVSLSVSSLPPTRTRSPVSLSLPHRLRADPVPLRHGPRAQPAPRRVSPAPPLPRPQLVDLRRPPAPASMRARTHSQSAPACSAMAGVNRPRRCAGSYGAEQDHGRGQRAEFSNMVRNLYCTTCTTHWRPGRNIVQNLVMCVCVSGGGDQIIVQNLVMKSTQYNIMILHVARLPWCKGHIGVQHVQ